MPGPSKSCLPLRFNSIIRGKKKAPGGEPGSSQQAATCRERETKSLTRPNISRPPYTPYQIMNEQESAESFREKYSQLLKVHRENIGAELSIEARQVINALDAAGDWVFPKTIAATIKVTPERAVFLLERLVASGHARRGGTTMQNARYMIEQKGRAAVH